MTADREYRVRCGDAIHSEWLETDEEAWAIAIRKGLAYEHHDGTAGLGPLTWIEGRRIGRPNPASNIWHK